MEKLLNESFFEKALRRIEGDKTIKVRKKILKKFLLINFED